MGHRLVRLLAYRTLLVRPTAEEWNAAVPHACAACFTSPSTVTSFLEAAEVHGFLSSLDHILAASFGGATEEALLDAGFRNLATAAVATPEALARVVASSV